MEQARNTKENIKQTADRTRELLKQDRSPVEKVTIIAGVLLLGMMVGACFNAIGHASKARKKKKAERQAARVARRNK